MNTRRNAPVGRPRAFDADEALDRAMRVFWQNGYEGASLPDLLGAMGISRTSMYAAFGNKEDLFRKALARYADGPASYGAEAVAAPTAREVATVFLHGAVRSATMPGYPTGCLSLRASLIGGEDGQVIRDLLAAWRDETSAMLRKRFQRAVDEGDLPAGTDPALLTRYVMTIGNGVAVQAAAGAPRDELQLIADAVLRSWPPVLARPHGES
ncbi:TetR/AcrR family transcriptional regulator [Catenuloplanes atrovinosus]|uniref:AcrR family transcriptional regulator n=1 Tax=Catenuloplanes atrovinosus TaxID=137266 RepID=A0AAE3YNB6_9ACTN|nr:TetR/AcrR family transcriptional regulator [Catenuloplanes atrovinosus]MDR7275665.1 AcrR family transcriptional regulator [Catenuloplanes atrovinosus]